MRCLLDVNVLVALSIPQHTGHPRVIRWFKQEPGRKWATCPQTQAGFLRVGAVLLGSSRQSLQLLYAGLLHDCESPNHEFWPYSLDLRDATDIFKTRILGPNQITDLQLLLLAHKHHGQLVTLDAGIPELARGTRYANSVLKL